MEAIAKVPPQITYDPMRFLDHFIPKRFQHATLDSFRVSTDSQAKALEAVRGWLENIKEGPMLALVGPQGVGKSHLLYGAVRALAERFSAGEYPLGRMPFCRPWYRLAHELKGGDYGEREKARSSWWDAPAAVLDEVRATSSTETDSSVLAQYACHAYDSLRPVLLTTNTHPLAAVMGAPAADRFAVVQVVAKSGRAA